MGSFAPDTTCPVMWLEAVIFQQLDLALAGMPKNPDSDRTNCHVNTELQWPLEHVILT